MIPVAKLMLPVVFSAILASSALAQKPKATATKPAATAVQKFKPPKLTSSLGKYSDSANVIADEAVQLIMLPLKITDDKKTVYTISSYQVMYKRRAVSEDEETGKAIPAGFSNVAQLFRETPMSEIWKKTITEQLRDGEEIYFFDIIAKDPQGRLMFAPDLKLKIK